MQAGGSPQKGPSPFTAPSAQPQTAGSATLSNAGEGMASTPTLTPNTGTPSWALPLAAAGIGAAGALLAVAAVGCATLAGLAAARGLQARRGCGGDAAPPGSGPRGSNDAQLHVGSFAATGPSAGRGPAEPRNLRRLYSCSELDGPCKILIPEDTAATSHGSHPTHAPRNSSHRDFAGAAETPDGVCHHALAARPGAGHPKHAPAADCMRSPPPAAAWPSPGPASAEGLGVPPVGAQQGQWPYIPARPPPYPATFGASLGRRSASAAEDGSRARRAHTLPPMAQRTWGEHEVGSGGGGDKLAALQDGGCTGRGALANGQQQGPISSEWPRVCGRLQGAALPPSPFVELTSLPFYN